MIEGKDPMPFPAYVKLARILAQSPDPEHVAAHLFLLLDWNMVSRAENVCNAHLNLFGIFDGNQFGCFNLFECHSTQDFMDHVNWNLFSTWCGVL